MPLEPQDGEFWVVRVDDRVTVAEAGHDIFGLEWWLSASLASSGEPRPACDVTPIRKVDLTDAP